MLKVASFMRPPYPLVPSEVEGRLNGKAAAAAATRGGIRVGDLERRATQILNEIHRRSLNQVEADRVDDQLHAVSLGHGIAVLKLAELELVGEAGTAAAVDREAGLELREDIDTVLEPGMVVSMEPMIMLPEGLPGAGGYREHDILIVNENGAENITKFPYGPEKNIIRK